MSELNDAEMTWVQKEDSFMNGYNQTFGGDSFSSVKSESVKKVFDCLFNSDMTQREISELCDISEEMV
nr:MAG TPA: ECF sigma factor [Bacteriophage sp.]